MNNTEMNSEATATTENFWSLINQYEIVIPRIQRDYAQGRTDDVTSQIRNRFLEDIFSVLLSDSDKNEKLDVNFIYGNVENTDEYNRFIPIDGQQRLTTLFLIYWYFAEYSGRIEDKEIQDVLLKFRYETRSVTTTFCENIVKYVRINFNDMGKDYHISDIIRNYYWFFSDFDNDPSISGMLVMIDAIDEKATEYSLDGITLNNVFEKLISKDSPIIFRCLNLDDAGLTDSIYIKMNARGKALTNFENFKAQLSDYLSEDKGFANDFICNINGLWSEFFWHEEYRKKTKDSETGKEIVETNLDQQMMKFFRFCMLMDYIVNIDEGAVTNGDKRIRDSLRKLINEKDNVFTARLFHDNFKEVYDLKAEKGVLGISTFRKISKLLNAFAYRKKKNGNICFIDSTEFDKQYVDEENSFRRLIGVGEGRNLGYEEQVVIFAEYAFIIKYSQDDGSFNKETELNRWVRLIYNLVKPTLNFQLDVLLRMIRAVNSLLDSGYAINCSDYMKRLNRRDYAQSPLSVFTDAQVIEESIKAILMDRDIEWKKAFVEAENTFMDGHIEMLFSFSGIRELYEKKVSEYEDLFADSTEVNPDVLLNEVNPTSEYYKKFVEYLHKFEMIFDKDGIKEELDKNNIFRRALLCYGGADSYMLPPNKTIQSFLDNTDRDFGFRRLLRYDKNSIQKRNYLRELMDDIDFKRPITDQLQDIIDNKKFDENERWKIYFVTMPEILNSLFVKGKSTEEPYGGWVFKDSKRFIRRNSNDDILLLTRTQTSSTNRELYTYVLFLKAREKGLSLEYHSDYTDGAEKYAQYIDKNGQEVHVLYEQKDESYCYVARNSEGELYQGNIDQMLDYVKQRVGGSKG